MIGEKRPSSELLGWSLDLDQPIWKKAFFDEILCLARMHGLELWLVSCLLGYPCQGLFPFLSWIAPFIGLASTQNDSTTQKDFSYRIYGLPRNRYRGTTKDGGTNPSCPSIRRLTAYRYLSGT